MIKIQVDLGKFPPTLHRIIRTWYVWQAVDLHKSGALPGRNITSDQLVWSTRPPAMTNDGELCFLNDGEISYYLVIENDHYYIDKKSRSSRGRYWMFRRFEDAEKYMLFLISQMVRPGRYADSPGFHWYREGLDPRVTLTKDDPVNHPGRVRLTVDKEAIDRGWMTEHNAVAGSHIIVPSFNELEKSLREQIPNDWFSIDVVTDR
ncbi:hypothetical protein [Mycobacterium sherrisii]|uniref:hypothetical protein n=1 Tax=Mycobacterium sherrisii TaxID=243061 RepID=UPI000A064712|nr:hypothetical protein [Mycobacterium sherrisii]MCV7029365.1 hypothetical protein [Mycobacterium sherrisii]